MKKCPFCAEEIQDAAVFCKHCHRELVQSTPPVAVVASATTTSETPYYSEVFARIEENQGRFLATWNWPAFLFSVFWYLAKGLWAKVGLMFLLAILTGGVAAPFIWLYAAIAGNYDYYLLRRKQKQLW